MVRVLSDGDVASLLDLDALLPVVEEAFRRQGRGEVERPERPHFPVGAGLEGDEPLGTGLVMPAYVHGAAYYATKLVGVHEGNPARGLPTVNAQIALTEAATGRPAAYLAGTRITNARTGCIGGLAAKYLASGPASLGLIGAGTQARWQARAVAAAIEVETVRVYSPSDSREACAADLRAEGLDAEAVDSPREAVADASVVVTATTSTEPTFPGDALAPGTLVVAVGAYTPEMRELDAATVERAARIFADVPGEAATVGDLPNADPASLVPLSAAFEGEEGRRDDEEVLVVESVGSAVLDAAAAEHVLERAIERDAGTTVEL
ncbi:ornithine cyclodeaminase family protein [Halegenticoccus soli]|uniref:ornithine cyclodeaminase family protein n=1 Tax=Halegenticoccus soli TaxID=1985678 RepID=UPI000C6EDC30|nr:ornithine cyclodeaminase family protein [Halegenticoccus soli]